MKLIIMKFLRIKKLKPLLFVVVFVVISALMSGRMLQNIAIAGTYSSSSEIERFLNAVQNNDVEQIWKLTSPDFFDRTKLPEEKSESLKSFSEKWNNEYIFISWQQKYLSGFPYDFKKLLYSEMDYDIFTEEKKHNKTDYYLSVTFPDVTTALDMGNWAIVKKMKMKAVVLDNGRIESFDIENVISKYEISNIEKIDINIARGDICFKSEKYGTVNSALAYFRAAEEYGSKDARKKIDETNNKLAQMEVEIADKALLEQDFVKAIRYYLKAKDKDAIGLDEKIEDVTIILEEKFNEYLNKEDYEYASLYYRVLKEADINRFNTITEQLIKLPISVGIYFDLPISEKVLGIHKNNIYTIAFSPDGRILASGSSDRAIKIWDINTGELINTFKGHEGAVFTIAFSPDGRILASGSRDKTVKLWNISSGKLIRTFPRFPRYVNSILFNTDGKILITGTTEGIRFLDVISGEMIKGIGIGALTLALNQEGNILASGYRDRVNLLNTATGERIKILNHSDPRSAFVKSIDSICFSPNSTLLATGSGAGLNKSEIRLWDVDSGDYLRSLRGHWWYVKSITFSPDGMIIASGSSDDSIKLWNTESGRLLKEFGESKDSRHSGTYVSFSPDGKILAAGCDDGSIRLLSIKK